MQLLPTELPRSEDKRQQEFERARARDRHVAGADRKQIRKQTKDLPANPVTLKQDVGYDLVYYLRENQAQYPGVERRARLRPQLPAGHLAAQILGYSREVTEEQLKEPRYQGLQPGDQVGQSGVEDTYDNVLRGTNGLTQGPGRRQRAADGRHAQPGRAAARRQPDAHARHEASRRPARRRSGRFSTPGAFVAMNVHNGADPRAGFSPTYDPSVFTKPVIPQSTYDQIYLRQRRRPLIDRAIQAAIPPGSTFKPITAIAALESGVLTPTRHRRRRLVHGRRP